MSTFGYYIALIDVLLVYTSVIPMNSHSHEYPDHNSLDSTLNHGNPDYKSSYYTSKSRNLRGRISIITVAITLLYLTVVIYLDLETLALLCHYYV
jgi:hypothetical protein